MGGTVKETVREGIVVEAEMGGGGDISGGYAFGNGGRAELKVGYRKVDTHSQRCCVW